MEPAARNPDVFAAEAAAFAAANPDIEAVDAFVIDVNGNAFTVTYGRIGTAGVSKTTECASAADAEAQAEKLVREKTKKGYAAPGAADRETAQGRTGLLAAQSR